MEENKKPKLFDKKTTLIYPSGLASRKKDSTSDDNMLAGSIVFSVFERKSRKDAKPLGWIHLYMPERLENPNTVRWGDSDFGTIKGSITRGIENASNGNMNSSLENFGTTVLGSFYDRAIKSAAQKNLAFNDVVDVATYTGGVIPNPYLTLLFQGVDFRSFQFDFKLYPHSEEEAQTIYDIITTFRASALPSGISAANSSGDSPFLGYPNEFEIEYKFANKPNKWLNKFKRCVLTNIDVNYTSTGQWTTLRNGFPTEIDMNLTFKEIEILVQDDVLNGW